MESPDMVTKSFWVWIKSFFERGKPQDLIALLSFLCVTVGLITFIICLFWFVSNILYPLELITLGLASQGVKKGISTYTENKFTKK